MPRRITRSLLLLLLFGASAGSSSRASAQDEPGTLGSVRPGTRVRLLTTQGQLMGRFVRFVNNTVDLADVCPPFGCRETTPRHLSINLREIFSGEYRKGNHAKKGLLIGFATGALITLAVLLPQKDTDDFDRRTAIPLGIGVLGGAGGLIGGLIGLAKPAWVTIDLPRISGATLDPSLSTAAAREHRIPVASRVTSKRLASRP